MRSTLANYLGAKLAFQYEISKAYAVLDEENFAYQVTKLPMYA
jgi:hypothetical protein